MIRELLREAIADKHQLAIDLLTFVALGACLVGFLFLGYAVVPE